MWYWIVFALAALWIVRDGWARKIQPGWMVAAVVGAVILGPVAVPLYFALRP